MKPLLLALLLLHAATALAQPAATEPAYPRVVGYASVVHPIVAVDADGSHWNFTDAYTVSFPMGLNLLKSARVGFSFEVAPFIKVQDGKDHVSSILFHPGVMFRRSHGFTFTLRAAFETNGRYGLTPVFNQVVVRSKQIGYFAAVGLPMRAGADKPLSFGSALQLGVVF